MVTLKLSELKKLDKNPRTIKKEDMDKLKASIKKFGIIEGRPFLVSTRTGENVIIGGNMRYEACKSLGIKEVPVHIFENLTEEEENEIIIRDNVSNGEWDMELLANDWDTEQLIDWGLDVPGFDEGKGEYEYESGSVLDKFLIPPFSIFDTRQGYWKKRKDFWIHQGIQSELGRSENLMNDSKNKNSNIGLKYFAPSTSIFDPVLCEIGYKWFNIDNGLILDPFAGGSVRGIIAGKLGYNYIGNDLRKEQIDENIEQGKSIISDSEIMPVWTHGDSINIKNIVGDIKADLIFSCPPYADLEVYSDKKEDISNMSYNDFIVEYRKIIKNSCELLNDDRFAIFIVGDVRDKKGFYYDFISDTKKAFIDAGLKLYNEIIYIEPLGTGAMRAGQYMKNRKVVKCHQNFLVFYKGDLKKIKDNFGDIEFLIEEEI